MIEHINIDDFKKLVEEESCQIIDVREEGEYQYVRIAGSKLVPLSEFNQKMSLINKELPSYYLCGVGQRALRAAEYLDSVGYKDLYVIDGGIKAWLEKGFPVESG